MSRGKIHLITNIFGSRIETKCGRDGRIDEDGFLVQEPIKAKTDWNCAREQTTCQMSGTFDKNRVDCKICRRRIHETE